MLRGEHEAEHCSVKDDWHWPAVLFALLCTCPPGEDMGCLDQFRCAAVVLSAFEPLRSRGTPCHAAWSPRLVEGGTAWCTALLLYCWLLKDLLVEAPT